MESLKTFENGNALIVCDSFSYEKKPEIHAFLESKELKHIIELVQQDFILVLGGDGTMLRAVQSYYPDGLPFLGINFGTKGFLLNDQNIVKKTPGFTALKYPLLEAIVSIEGQADMKHVAMNEIQVKTASGGMADLTFDIGELSRVQTKGDGLLIVTPAGSTGYNQSAGGPVLPHSSHHFIATPLLPFEPRGLRPIVYESSEDVVIVNNNERRRKLSVYADSIAIIEGSDANMRVLVREYKDKITLLIADNYKRIWKAKTFAEQGMEVL